MAKKNKILFIANTISLKERKNFLKANVGRKKNERRKDPKHLRPGATEECPI